MRFWNPLILLVVSILVYGNTLKHPFVWDDTTYVSNNSHFQNVKYIGTYFTSQFCEGVTIECAFYRPVVSLSYLVDYQIWGDNPFGFHLTNVILHAMVVLLFYGVTLRLFQNPLMSFIGALLFSVHPIHSESVSFIAARTDPLASLFFLTSFYFFNQSLRNHPPFSFFSQGMVLVCFGLGLLTKEMVITLPIVFFLYDYILVRPWKGFGEAISRWPTYLPLGLVIFFYLMIRQQVLGFGFSPENNWEGILGRILNAPALLWDYTRLLVVPYPLTIFHDKPNLFDSAPLTLIWGICFLSLLLYVLFRIGRFSKEIVFGGLWMIVTLVPVLNLIPIPWPIVVERFSYIPSIGFSLSVAFCWGRLMKRGAHPAIPLAGKVWAGVGIGVLFLFFLMTVNQNRIWGSDILLWEDTVRKAPHFAMGHMNLGNAYQESGQLEQAAQAYENSLKHVSPSPRLLHNLGTLYQNMGKTQKAEEIFLALVKQNLAVSGTFHNLGILYEEKDLNRSVVFYREELARNPKIYKTHVRLGKVLVRLEKKEEALKEFQEAIEIFSDKPEAYIHLGVLLKKMGRFQEAREVFIRYFNLENPEEKHSEIYLNAQKEFREVQRELGQVDP